MNKPLFDLSGRVSVVSGAAQGMGRATALALAEAGSDLVLVDRNSEGMQQTAELIDKIGRRNLQVVIDVASGEQVCDLYRQVDEEFGQVDFVANIAGEGMIVAPEDLTEEQLIEVLKNLVVGRYVSCREAGRRMLAQGRGSIVNIGSLASITALGRSHVSYSMAMGAVAQMTRELSTEWVGRGVRVNAILPAQVINPHLQQRMDADPQLEGQFLSGIPAGRMGVPEDIQGLMVLLASDASSWISGALIPMDGGNLAMNAGGTPGWLSAQGRER
jgi:NAD(P)-dependent dehydrogenase (short-subunit alcohol dehydrogenase family)